MFKFMIMVLVLAGIYFCGVGFLNTASDMGWKPGQTVPHAVKASR